MTVGLETRPSGLRGETYWSRFARTYDESAEFVVGRSLRREIARRLGQERELGEVIEFGCGTGYFTQAIASNATRVLATDLSDEMLEAARLRLAGFANVAIGAADCELLVPFPAGSFDTVLMANVLHVIGDPRAALRESRRLLRHGGLLLVIVYTDDGMSWLGKLLIALKYLVTFGFPPPYGIRNYAPHELRHLVEASGFTVGELERIGAGPQALYRRATRGAPGERRGRNGRTT